MSATISYRGSTIATVDNTTKILLTEGKYMESNVVVTDVTSGGSATIEPLSVTANGTYTAPSGVDGYSPVTVNVSSSDPYPVRNDGKWHLWVLVDDLTRPDVTIRYRQSVSEGITVNWGDGSSNTYTGTGAASRSHNYSATGVYEITLTKNSGYLYSAASYSASNSIMGSKSAFYNVSRLLAAEIVPLYSTTSPVNANNNIANYTFANCINLEKLTIQEGYVTLNASALYECNSLKYVSIPSTATTIYNSFLRNLSPLEKVDIKQGATAGTILYFFQNCSNLKEVKFPVGFYSQTGNQMFEGCTSLKVVDIPSDMEWYGAPFYNTSLVNIRTFNAPSMTAIPAELFNNATQLMSFRVPSGVTAIGSNAFANCTSLAEIHFLPTTPPTVEDSNAWTNLSTTCTIYVPTGTLSAYTSASNYPDPATYTYIEE